MVSATTSGESPNPFPKSAETGKSLATTIKRVCASASMDSPVLNGAVDSLCGDLEEILLGQGLYRDEAHATETWRERIRQQRSFAGDLKMGSRSSRPRVSRMGDTLSTRRQRNAVFVVIVFVVDGDCLTLRDKGRLRSGLQGARYE